MNRWMHRLLAYLTVACVALLVGVWTGSHSVVGPGGAGIFDTGLGNVPAAVVTGSGKLQELSEKELEEYLELKGLREKYEKADELLGKALLILIEDFGLKLSERQRLYAQNAARGIHAPAPDPSPTGPFGPEISPSHAARGGPLLAVAPAAHRVAGNSPAGLILLDRLGGGRTDLTGVRLGWVKEGRTPDDYEAGFLAELDPYGEPVATIRAWRESPRPFGALSHVLEGREYSGKRAVLRALVKGEGLKEGGSLFMRAENNSGQAIANQQVVFRDSFDWKSFDLTLEVPLEAARLVLGVLLEGHGQVWLKSVTVNPGL